MYSHMTRNHGAMDLHLVKVNYLGIQIHMRDLYISLTPQEWEELRDEVEAALASEVLDGVGAEDEELAQEALRDMGVREIPLSEINPVTGLAPR